MIQLKGEMEENQLHFFDYETPWEYKDLIKDELGDYKEQAWIEEASSEPGAISIILKLDPSKHELSPEYRKEQSQKFKKYYEKIIRKIRSNIAQNN
jgi:hypothetical protein